MKKKSYFYIISVIFLMITIFGTYKVLSTVYDYKIGKDTYDTLKEYTMPNVIENQSESNISWPTIDFKTLKKINKDIIGWISIDNLNINYPIVQGNDNDYYLNHLADGSYNGIGSIFMDYRNQSNLDDRHSILYGHNIQNGTMFSNITKYKEQEYYDNNPYYLIITENKNYKVEIISGYVTNINDNSWSLTFKDNEEFENWLNNTTEKSLIKTNITPTIENNIITLSTCSYEFDNTRFVLVGILIEQ